MKQRLLDAELLEPKKKENFYYNIDMFLIVGKLFIDQLFQSSLSVV